MPIFLCVTHKLCCLKYLIEFEGVCQDCWVDWFSAKKMEIVKNNSFFAIQIRLCECDYSSVFHPWRRLLNEIFELKTRIQSYAWYRMQTFWIVIGVEHYVYTRYIQVTPRIKEKRFKVAQNWTKKLYRTRKNVNYEIQSYHHVDVNFEAFSTYIVSIFLFQLHELARTQSLFSQINTKWT